MLANFPMTTEPPVRAAGPPIYPAAFTDLLANVEADRQFLVEIEAYKGGEVRSGGLAGIAEIPVAANPPNAGVNIGLVWLSFSDRHWIGAPDDTQKPNEFYEGRASVPVLIERAMPLLPEESRRALRQFGDVELVNGDGYFDPLLQSYAVDGRRVRVLLGPRMGAYADFAVIADVVADNWRGDSLQATISLRDRSFNLDLPLQDTLYAGTGGAEGTAEIEGKPKPLVYGRCRNITPVLIDPANLIYQFHDGAAHAVDGVFDRGAEITASGADVASYAALVSQSVSSGEFATALSVGLFKLGALPSGLVTCDVRGDASPSYIDTLDLVILRLIRDKAGISDQFIDYASFAGVAAIGGEMGIYINQNQTPSTGDVVGLICSSAAAWWGTSRQGLIRGGRLHDPAGRAAHRYLDSYDIVSLAPDETPVPRWRQRVGYQPNWTVQRGEDLAAAVTAERRQYLTEPARVVQTADTTVKVRHRQASDPAPLLSLFESETPAQNLSDTLHALFSATGRQIFSIVLQRLGFVLDLGSIVNVKWPRYGLSSGKNFIVIGVTDTPDAVTLRVWG